MDWYFLSAILENQGGEKSLLDSMVYAFLPIAKVSILCFIGYLMASEYFNILPPNDRKLLNSLVFSLLLPCLIFSQLGRAVTFEKIMKWWFIPINVVLSTVVGSLVGFIMACIVRPPYPYFKFTIVHIGTSNIGNVPLVLISSLCRDATNPFGSSEKCRADGIAYISFGQWVGAVIVYTFVIQMLAPPPGSSFDSFEGKKTPLENLPVNPSSERVPLLASLDHQLSELSPKGGKGSSIIWFLMEKLKLKQILQPALIASVRWTSYLALCFAIATGCVPFLKRMILTDGAPLFFFTDSCIILGEAMIPCILLALGGNLVDGPGVSKVGVRTTLAIIIGRLLVVPLLGLGIVTLADKLGFLPAGDKMFKFVLLLQHSMPTAVLCGAIANLRGCGQESAAVLFWVNIMAIFTMAGWIVLYLNLLF